MTVFDRRRSGAGASPLSLIGATSTSITVAISGGVPFSTVPLFAKPSASNWPGSPSAIVTVTLDSTGAGTGTLAGLTADTNYSISPAGGPSITGRTLTAVAPPGPVWSAQPSVAPAAPYVGQTITFSEGAAAGSVITFTRLDLDVGGVVTSKLGELVGLAWDTAGESAGTIRFQFTATRNGTSVTSDLIEVPLAAALSLKQQVEALALPGATGRKSTAALKVPGVDSLAGMTYNAGTRVVTISGNGVEFANWLLEGVQVTITGTDVWCHDNVTSEETTLIPGSAPYAYRINATAHRARVEDCDYIGSNGTFGCGTVVLQELLNGQAGQGTETTAQDVIVRRLRILKNSADGLKRSGNGLDVDRAYFGPFLNMPPGTVAYDPTRTYGLDEWVIVASSIVARSLQANNLGNTPGDGTTETTAWWQNYNPHADATTQQASIGAGSSMRFCLMDWRQGQVIGVGATQYLREARNSYASALMGRSLFFGCVLKGPYAGVYPLSAFGMKTYSTGRAYIAGELMEWTNFRSYRCVANAAAGESPGTHPAKWEETLDHRIPGPFEFRHCWVGVGTGGRWFSIADADMGRNGLPIIWDNVRDEQTGALIDAPDYARIENTAQPAFGAAAPAAPAAPTTFTGSVFDITPTGYVTTKVNRLDATICSIRAGAFILGYIKADGTTYVDAALGASLEDRGGGVWRLKLLKADGVTPLVAAISIWNGAANVVADPVTAPVTITVDSGSLRFPDGNGGQPTNALAPAYLADGANWAPSASKIFDPAGSGVFAALIEVPWEAIKLGATQRMGILGNMSGGTNNQTLGIYATRGANEQDDRLINFFLRDGVGVILSDSVAVSPSQRRLLVAMRMVAGQMRFEVYHKGALVGAAKLPAMSTFAAMQLRSQLTYGVQGSGATQGFTSSGSQFGFVGSIAWVGYHNTGFSQTDCEAMSLGADPLVQASAAGWRMYRRLVDTSTESLTKPAGATGDATVAMVPFNTRSIAFRKGGDLAAARSGSMWFRVDGIKDGRVFARLAGEITGRIYLSGEWSGLSGAVQARVFDAADGRIRRDWTNLAGLVVDPVLGTWSGHIDSPPNSGWGHIDVRPASTPALVQRIRARTGVGLVLSIGPSQSQVARCFSYSSIGLGVSGGAAAVSCQDVPQQSETTWGFLLHPITDERRMSDALAHVASVLPSIPGYTGEPVMLLNMANPGNYPYDILQDAFKATGDQDWSWAGVEAALAAALGPIATRRISAGAMNWLTSLANKGGDPGGIAAYYLRPLFEGVFGTGATQDYTIDHYLRDGTTFPSSMKWGLSIPTRYGSDNAGPHDDSTGSPTETAAVNHGRGRQQWLDYAAANPSIIAAVGPWTDDLQIEPLGGPHQDPNSIDGHPRTLRRMVETGLRAMLMVTRTDPSLGAASINGARNAITITANRPNAGALQTGWAIKGVAVPSGWTTVQGFEVQNGGTGAWTRSGFTAEIVSGAVVLTKASGSWAAGTRVRYNHNGPLSYGTAAPVTLYHGSLYEAGPDDGGLGLPLAGLWTSAAL